MPSTCRELPFLESLLSFLEMDCGELTLALRRVAENWERLLQEDDREAGTAAMMELGQLKSKHIYLELLYVRCYDRFSRMGAGIRVSKQEDREMLEELRASRNSSRCISGRSSGSLTWCWMWTRRGVIHKSRHRPTTSTTPPRTRPCSPSGPSPQL
ncbi:hypothetical protein M5E87_05660 [Flavonifractor plautii]|nr:hypothetical protein M5E87_05660 [Flavonifractor plautii]